MNKIHFWIQQRLLDIFWTPIGKQVDFNSPQESLFTLLKKYSQPPQAKIIDDKLLKKLSAKKIVIVCNHPHIIEPLVLLSCLPYLKSYIVVMRDVFYDRLPALQKRLLPVYITHHYFPDPKLEQQESLKNRQTIAKAASLLKKDKSIVIFPGASTNDLYWKSGVGHLLSQANDNQHTYLLPCHITGTSHYDPFRLVPLLGKLFPHPTVTIGKPILISSISISKDPKKLTKDLFAYYNSLYPIATKLI